MAGARDAFRRTIARGSAWGTADEGGYWTSNSPADTQVDGDEAVAYIDGNGSLINAFLPSMAEQNFDVSLTFLASALPAAATSHFGEIIMRRSKDGLHTYRARLTFNYNGGAQQLLGGFYYSADGGSVTIIGSDTNTGITPVAATKYRVRAQALGSNPTHLRMKVWAVGTPEPSAWLLGTTNSQAQLQGISGHIGIRVQNATTNASLSYRLSDLVMNPVDTYELEVRSDNPIVYYRMNSTADPEPDVIGNLDMLRDSTPTRVSGLIGSSTDGAQTVNGTNQAFHNFFDTVLPNGDNAWTMEAWIATTSASANNDIMGWGTQSGDGSVSMRLNNGLFLFANNNRTNNFSGAFNDGLRHHLVITYDGVTMKGYADGVQQGGAWTVPVNFAIVRNMINVGVWSGWFNGTIDEVAVYGTALPGSRIAAHYTAGGTLDTLLLESGGTDGYLLEDGSGVLVDDGAAPMRFYLTDSDTYYNFWYDPNTAGWTDTSVKQQRFMLDRKTGEAMIDGQTVTLSGTAGAMYLDRLYASMPIKAQLISGTVSAQMLVRELAATDNLDRAWIRIAVVTEDGAGERGVLLAKGNYGPTNEFDTANRNKILAARQSLTPVAASEGDRITVEIGYGNSTAGTTPQAVGRWGDADTDLPEDESTAVGTPWVEFSQAILLTNDSAMVDDFQRAVTDDWDTASQAAATYAALVLADLPSSYWPFDEPSGTNADDKVTTSNNDGTYNGTPTLGSAGPLNGATAVALNGTTQFVAFGDVLDMGSVGSWEFWFKRGRLGVNEALMSKGTGQPNITIGGSTDNIIFGDNNAAPVSQAIAAHDTTMWHHLVFVRSGPLAAQQLLYVDGRDQTAVIGSDPLITANSSALKVGALYDDTQKFQGSMAQVAVYPYALTTQQVAAHYKAGRLQWMKYGGADTAYDVDGARGTFTLPGFGDLWRVAAYRIRTTEQLVTAKFRADKVPVGGGLIEFHVYPRALTSRHFYRIDVDIGPAGSVRIRLFAVVNDGYNNFASIDPLSRETFIANQDFNIKVEATGTNPTTVRAKVWRDGTSEPGAWDVSGTDSSAALQGAGSLSIAASADDVGSTVTISNLPIVESWDALYLNTTPPGGPGTVSGSFNLNAVLKATRSSAFPASAVIKRTQTPTGFALNAVIKRTQTATTTANAVLKKTLAGTFTVNASLVLTRTGTFTANATIKATITAATTANAVIKGTRSATFTVNASLVITRTGSTTLNAVIKRTQTPTGFAVDAVLDLVGRAVWTTPADGVPMSGTPALTFLMPPASGPMHFEIQVDEDIAYGSPFIYKSHQDLTGWEYWNGSAWTPVPQAGVSASFSGNEARYTVQTPLASGTYYRRVRAGVF